VSAWRSAGLLVAAAAVVATSGAARIPDGGAADAAGSVAVGTAGGIKAYPAQSSGQVVATVPAASFGPSDAVPQLLVAGRTYPVVITVWVAAKSGPAVIGISTSSGRLTGCAQRIVPAGVTRVRCTLNAAPAAALYVSIGVSARTHDHGIVVRTYPHALA
jgi:hypothetical protein